MRNFLRDYPVATTVTLVSIGGVVGTIVFGLGFIAKTWPVAPLWAGVWMCFNICLAVIAFACIYRNMYRSMTHLTWQERGFTRGVLLLLFAGVLGYLARAFSQPTVSMGSAVFTLSCLVLIWATVRPPERFEGSDGGDLC